MICLLIEVDIPQLSYSGIQFGYKSFQYTYSLQSSSTHSLFSSSLDAPGLELFIMSNSSYSPLDPSRLLIDNATVLNTPSDCLNGSNITSLSISNNGDLRRIVIENDSFGCARLFELDGLSELESVIIQKKGFTYSKTDDIWFSVTRTDGTCRIKNCPKLKSIQIDDLSFGDYHSFELNNLPSLQSIDIGHRCFHDALSFSLTGLIG